MMASARSRGLAGVCVFAVAGLSLSVAATLDPADEPPRVAMIQQPAGAAGKASPPRAAQPADDEALVLRGRVLDPDGKPVAGAQLVLNVPTEEPGERRSLGKTGPDGQFTVSIPRHDLRTDDPGARDIRRPRRDGEWVRTRLVADRSQ